MLLLNIITSSHITSIATNHCKYNVQRKTDPATPLVWMSSGSVHGSSVLGSKGLQNQSWGSSSSWALYLCRIARTAAIFPLENKINLKIQPITISRELVRRNTVALELMYILFSIITKGIGFSINIHKIKTNTKIMNLFTNCINKKV